MVINFVLNNINIFKKAYLWFLDEQIAKNILTFISENKWMLLTTFGVVFLVYEVLKDRFTNKIISEIHDEELKNIIITHKELFMDFITLRNTLCFNINHFFDTPKENGIIYHIHMSITEKFPSFEFDSVHRSFKKKECQNLYSLRNIIIVRKYFFYNRGEISPLGILIYAVLISLCHTLSCSLRSTVK